MHLDINFIKFYYKICGQNKKNCSIVTKCKYEFKNALNPCKITKRREEKRRELFCAIIPFEMFLYTYASYVCLREYKKGYYYG